jgi:5'-3' exonuclease
MVILSITMNFVLIDGSYYVFYRYHALHVWWKHAKPDDDATPCESEVFRTKFRDTFLSKIGEIDKKLGIKESVKIVGKDCPRSKIWRNRIHPEYKGTRGDCSKTVGPFFAMTYGEGLFQKAGVHAEFEYPTLEADDCIAITTKHIRKSYPDAHVWIITSDTDYLQLAEEKVHIYSLQFKDLTKAKSCSGDPKQDLFCKIVSGDKSDNISAVFDKCGPKTAAKLYKDRDMFDEKLSELPESQNIYMRNSVLVDFASIPKELVDGFTETNICQLPELLK